MHRHKVKGRKLSREKGHRELMLRNMATSVILHEKIKTTLPKAKEIRPIVEKLITTAKKGDLAAIRKLNAYLLDKNATEKMITEIAPLYEKRHGGYTRITKIGLRAGDAAEMAYIELLDVEKIVKTVKEKTKAKKVVKSKVSKATDKKEVKKVAEKKKVAK